MRLASTDEVPIISGIGVVGEAIFHGSFHPSVSYVDDFGPLDAHDLPRSPDPTTYLIHHACWLLLLSRLGVGPEDDSSRVVKLLFHTLQCTPKDSHGALLTRYTYYGAARFRQSFGYARSGYERTLPEQWRFLLADPDFDRIEELTTRT